MKIDLKDLTFIIPFSYDSIERAENLNYILGFFRDNFETNIVLIESGIKQFSFTEDYLCVPNYLFLPTSNEIFHRTKVINAGIKKAKTPYIAIYDTDVFISPIENYLKGVELLKQGHKIVYPYDGRFIDVERSLIKDGIIKEYQSCATGSYGGCVLLNRETYIEAGIENENLYGWGFDDFERKERMEILGNHAARIEGICYHIKHPLGINSSVQNPNWQKNKEEYERIKIMSEQQLRDEIKTWQWTKR